MMLGQVFLSPWVLLTALSSYNEAKIEVLQLVSDVGECTSFDVAEMTGRDGKAAAMALLRYYRQGLLYRYWGDYSYVYGITERGEGRLEYLLEVKRINELLTNLERTPVNR